MTDGTTRQRVTRRVVLGLLGAGLLPQGGVHAADPTEADRAALVRSNSEFGLDLYARLRSTSGNLFYSPYSISSALAMTYVGARGATADEMAKALRLSPPPARFHPTFGNLIRAINAPGTNRAAELYTANALWSQRGFPFESDFRQTAKESYVAALEELDFTRAPETARRTINAWVEQQTRDRIKDLVREGVLTSATTLVLTNAIYFKSAWQNPFREERTKLGDFALGAKDTIQNVPLMFQVEHYPYLEANTFQAIELPYKANELSLIIFLPRTVNGLEHFERTLTAARVDDWLAKMSGQKVMVILPRFKITSEIRLEQPLQDLGMRLAFSAGADFSGMTKIRGVFVDAAIHKAHVDVNERGTEAAAATAVAMTLSMPRIFRANHPFVFFIRDKGTGSLLFAGRLANPLAS